MSIELLFLQEAAFGNRPDYDGAGLHHWYKENGLVHWEVDADPSDTDRMRELYAMESRKL